MTVRDVISAIRRNHLQSNIDEFERQPRKWGKPLWSKAWIDGGGDWIYLHVPIKGGEWDGTAQRVYPPARLRRHLAAQFWPDHYRAVLERIAANGSFGAAWLVAVANEALQSCPKLRSESATKADAVDPAGERVTD